MPDLWVNTLWKLRDHLQTSVYVNLAEQEAEGPLWGQRGQSGAVCDLSAECSQQTGEGETQSVWEAHPACN